MLMKVSDLTGAALDYAVAQCNETVVQVGSSGTVYYFIRDNPVVWTPSTNWAQGGPIIEREEISILSVYGRTHRWEAECTIAPAHRVKGKGFYPLTTAMRCYVASRLGNTVEIPDEIGAKA